VADEPSVPREVLSWPVHPFLVGIGPVLAYYVDNERAAEVSQCMGPIALGWLFAGVVILGLHRWLGARKSALLASIALTVILANADDADEWWVLLLGAAALVIAGVWRGDLVIGTTLANLAATFALAQPVYGAVAWNLADHAPHVRADLYAWPPAPPPVDRAALPDIWFVLLDGHARQDVLASKFGLPDGFSSDLESRGFIVRRDAFTNYPQTALSLSSELNLAYLQDVLVDIDPSTTWRIPLKRLMTDSRATRLLKNAGYTLVSHPGEYSYTVLAGAEVRAPAGHVDEFGYVLSNTTPLPPISRWLTGSSGVVPQAVRRHQLRWILDDLATGDTDGKPTFHYVHVQAPHPEFVFNEDGSPRTSKVDATSADGSAWVGKHKHTHESYVDGYRAQVQWLDGEVLRAIDGILAHSERPPIILVQSDHGSGADLVWGDAEATDLPERMGILMAWYVPEADRARFADVRTPVNAFRTLLDVVLGTETGREPDKSYWATWGKPYTWVDVTEAVK
jgi:hypothetical protein